MTNQKMTKTPLSHVGTVGWKYQGHCIGGYKQLLECYGDQEFDSPTRSTIPLLAYWRNPRQRVHELSRVLEFPFSDQISLDFEHPVEVQRGRGKPSFTDLMLTSGDIALAIEAKWTEPRYEDVSTWIDGGSNRQNRTEVLKGWLDLLGRGCGPQLSVVDVYRLPYQLVHRAASACASDSTTRWLIYQLFDMDSEKQRIYLDDLQGLVRVLGPGRTLGVCAALCSIERSERQIELERRWSELGERNLREDVLAGIRDGGLFSVHLEKVKII